LSGGFGFVPQPEIITEEAVRFWTVLMARYPHCIWCRRTDSPPSKEDIFAKWIAREWPDKKHSHFEVVGGTSGQTPDRAFRAKGNMGLVTHGACESCNNGWMSAMETAVAQHLKPLMRGEPTVLDSAARLVITRWTLKTTVMYEYFMSHAHGPRERFFKPADRRAFFEYRIIPAHLFLFAGHHVGRNSLWVSDRSSPQTIKFEDSPDQCPGYSITFSVGQLVLHLFVYRPSKGGRITFTLPGIFREATVELWPALSNPTWPPEAKFDETGLDELAATWTTNWALKASKPDSTSNPEHH
jgi:hypothetical protein